MAMTRAARRRQGLPMSVGVVGLGIGTIAAYAEPGDHFRFYEINPDVIRVAEDPRRFTYLSDARGQVDVVAGDGRLAIEGEPEQRFDVLVLDAFGSDSVPAHLLTREAFALYASRLRDADSLLAVNVINRTLDLAPLVARTASEVGLAAIHVRAHPPEGDANAIELRSDWMLLAHDPAALDALHTGSEAEPASASGPEPWSDDFSNVIALLRWPTRGMIGR